jgi:rhodanese-related sulfurtransferase
MYVNNILCKEAWDILNNDPNALLVDVRTDFEWKNIGTPYVVNTHQLLLNSIKLYPQMNYNPEFIKVLLENANDRSKIFFLCRYGQRSLDSCNLAFQHGLDICYNLVDGFDGNEHGLGWKGSSLPIKF